MSRSKVKTKQTASNPEQATEKASRFLESVPLRLSADPALDKAAARQLHGAGLGGVAYGNAVAAGLGARCSGLNIDASASNYIEDVLERMAPRDPLEEMLVVQAVLTHARVLRLSECANKQERLESLRIVNEYADRASNTYRRLMLALAEYRRPPRAGDSFTAIRQANIAGQQVVQNGRTSRTGNATNEQGSKAAEAPQALPAEPGGAGVLAGLCRPREAVGAVQRAEDARGQGQEPDERLEAR